MHDKQVAAPDNTAVRSPCGGAARRSRFAAARVRRPSRLEAGGSRRRMAQPSDMSPFTRPFAPPSWPAPASSKIRRGTSCPPASGNTSSSERAWTHFAQRRPELASRLLVFEIDPPGPQAWSASASSISASASVVLRLVTVDFEQATRVGGLAASGFDSGRPGSWRPRCEHVPDKDAIAATLRQVAALASAPRSPCHSCFRSSWRTPRCVRIDER